MAASRQQLLYYDKQKRKHAVTLDSIRARTDVKLITTFYRHFATHTTKLSIPVKTRQTANKLVI